MSVPKSLRVWFVIHFIVDVITAVPLFIFPQEVLHYLGLTLVDPFSARTVASAFLAIGTSSLLYRDAGIKVYDSFLTLKIIWSLAAVLGLVVSMTNSRPFLGWIGLGIFSLFSVVWIYYKLQLSKK